MSEAYWSLCAVNHEYLVLFWHRVLDASLFKVRHLAMLFKELNDASFHFSLSPVLPGEILKMISDLAALFLFKREAISIFSFVNHSSATSGPGNNCRRFSSSLEWPGGFAWEKRGSGGRRRGDAGIDDARLHCLYSILVVYGVWSSVVHRSNQRECLLLFKGCVMLERLPREDTSFNRLAARFQAQLTDFFVRLIAEYTRV